MKFITIENSEPGVVTPAKLLNSGFNPQMNSEKFVLKGANSNQRILYRGHKKFNSMIDSITKSKGIDKD